MKTFSIVVAVDAKNGIGKGNQIPWRLSRDMQHFKEVTTASDGSGLPNVVIMGRNTWDSLPAKFRPLPGRVNAVITSNPAISFPEGVLRFASFDEAVDFFCVQKAKQYGEVFVIGGGMVYAKAVSHHLCKSIYLTQLAVAMGCDTFFPVIPDYYQEKSRSAELREGNLAFFFSVLESHLIASN